MTLPDETRHSLLARLRTGEDQRAWEEFFEIYQPLIYRVARARGLQDADAREIVQLTCVAVSGAIERFEHRGQTGDFRAWLKRITRNRTLNLIRSKSRRDDQLAGECQSMTGLPSGAAGPESLLFDAFEREHRQQVFCWAAEQIRQRVKTSNWNAFWETTVENRSVEVVAREYGLTNAQVHVARCRVLAKIRELVHQQFGDEVQS